MRIRIYIALLLSTFYLLGCDTYKRSFGETYQSPTDASLEKIYRLDLSHQQLSQLPDEVKGISKLRMLNLSGNTELDLEAALSLISNPGALEVLILDELKLMRLPNAIQRFDNLQHLSLNKNPDLDLGATMILLQDLKIEFLNLQNHGISNLPEEITVLTSLKSINLSHNALEGSENFEYLSKLPELRSLWLTNNQFHELPQEIGKLDQLKNLYLEHNLLTELPDSFSGLRKVFVLHLGHNRFRRLPLEIIEMPKLLLLHINNCEITDIPQEFAEKKYSLKSIIMDNNRLSQEDKDFWKKEFRGFFVSSFE